VLPDGRVTDESAFAAFFPALYNAVTVAAGRYWLKNAVSEIDPVK